MLELLFASIFEQIAEFTGGYEVICLGVMACVILMLLMFGLEFDFALLVTAPLPYAFYKGGYISAWISGAIIVIVLGTSIYMIWVKWMGKQ